MFVDLVQQIIIIIIIYYILGSKRELSGLLGSPNPFLIGWVRLGSIKICGGFGNGNSKSCEKPTVFRCRYFSSAFDRSKAFFFFGGGLASYTYFPRVLVEVLISLCQN